MIVGNGIRAGATIAGIVCAIVLMRAEAAGPRPEWVDTFPNEPAYYIGIASASASDGPNPQEAAKLQALASIASEISVSISSHARRKVEENHTSWSEWYQAEIESWSRTTLEGYERVGQWENGGRYWVYYRLAKKAHSVAQEKLRHAELERIRGLWLQAGTGLRPENPAFTLKCLLEALRQFRAYDLVWPSQGEDGGFSSQAIESRLRTLLAAMILTGDGISRQAARGLGLEQRLEIRAELDSAGKRSPLSHLPVGFSFSRGEGKLLADAETDSLGHAGVRVIQFQSAEPIQTVRAELDFHRVLGLEKLPEAYRLLIAALPNPIATFDVEVRKRAAFIGTEETNLDEPLAVPILESALKKALAQEGFAFPEDSSTAGLRISLRARTRSGSKVEGLCFAFLDMSLSVRDSTGRELYQASRTGIKGGHLDFPRAGLKAYEKASGILESSMIPQALKNIGP
jgi:hypothetical protein